MLLLASIAMSSAYSEDGRDRDIVDDPNLAVPREGFARRACQDVLCDPEIRLFDKRRPSPL